MHQLYNFLTINMFNLNFLRNNGSFASKKKQIPSIMNEIINQLHYILSNNHLSKSLHYSIFINKLH